MGRLSQRTEYKNPVFRIRLTHQAGIKLCDLIYQNESIKMNQKYNLYLKAKNLNIKSKLWTNEEINLIKNGLIPENRTLAAVYNKCSALNIKFQRSSQI